MRYLLAVFFVAALLGGACSPRHLTRTTRPVLDSSPWQELEVNSEASGHNYRYLFVAGPSDDAPAILLLHGGFFDHRMWLNTKALARHFNVYALEWPDNSPYYRGEISDYGDVAADFLKAVKVEEVYVAGVSFGAYGAIELITGHPEVNVKAFFLFSSVMFAISEDEVKVRTRMGRLALGMAPDRFRAFVQWSVERKDFEEVPEGIGQDEIFYVRPYTYYYQLFSSTLSHGDRPQDTGSVTCPTLVLQGTDDEIMPTEATRLTTGVFPDAEMVEFDGLGHSMVFSHGGEMVDVMIGFLKGRGLLGEDRAALPGL